jgi:hypothetical protein
LGSYQVSGYSTGNYVDPTDSGSKYLKQRKDDFYRTHYPANASMWQQGSIDTRFKAGDQSLYSMVYGDNNYFQARRFFFNLIKRQVNMICGYQRKNRKSTITMPTQAAIDPLVDDYNKCLKWSEDRDGFQEYLSQAFEGAVTTGISLLHLYPSYVLDPISGDLFTDQVAYCNFLIDSYFRKQDLSDCNGIWRRRWVTKPYAKLLLPGYASEIDKMQLSGMKDGRFPLQAELINLDTNKLIPYDEFNYRSTRRGKLIIDPKSGESVEWEELEDKDDDEAELKYVMQKQPWLRVKETEIPTVKVCISLGDKLVYDGPNLLNIDSYPYVPALCYHEPDIQSYMWKVTGVVRNLRDVNYLYNMRKVIEMDILQSQINSGVVYPVDAVVDPKCFRQTGQGYLVPLKAGHTKDEIQFITPPSIPQSIMELSRSLAEDLTRISGVNEELLGSAQDDKAGILSMLRQGAGLVTLQTIFDKLDYTQRLYGKIRLQAMRKNFSKGKIQSILGREPDQRFFTSHSLKYSIAVEEGNYSTTQRQMELQQLLHFRELGMPIADKSILEAAFITNKKQVIQDMQAQAQAQQEAQAKQAQQQAEVDRSKVMSSYAKARLDLASEKEKLAKVDEDRATAEHRRAESDLNLVKMMVELEGNDLEVMRNSFELAQQIKLGNTAINEQQKAIGD